MKDKQNFSNHSFSTWHFLKKNRLLVFCLIVLIFFCYGSSLNHDFVSDDLRAIPEIPYLGNFQKYVLEYPLNMVSHLTYFFAFHLGGYDPLYYRLFNIIFHAGSTIVLLLITAFLYNRRVAIFAASLYAVHPLLTESVTWISGSPYSYSSFFFLLSFYFYLRSEKNWRYLLFSFFFYLFMLESNQKSGIYFPVFILFELTIGKIKKNWPKLIPITIVSLLWIIILLPALLNRPKILAAEFSMPLQIQNPFYKIPYAIASYLWMFFHPHKLSLYHKPFPESFFENLPAILVFILYIAVIAISFFKNRHAFFWLLFFLIPLTPSFTPTNISWNVAERYISLGIIGLIIPLALFISKISYRKKIQSFVYFGFFLIIILSCVRSINRNSDWRNEKSLYISTLKNTPEDAKSHYNIAEIYRREGKFGIAAKEYRITLEIYPAYPDAYNGLAQIAESQGKLTDAQKIYEQALKLNPKYYQTYQNLGNLFFKMGDSQKAIEYLIAANELLKNDIFLMDNLAQLYFVSNQDDLAEIWFKKVLEISPDYQPSLKGLTEIIKQRENMLE